MSVEIKIFSGPDGLAEHVASWLVGRALAKKGRFTIALSGGSTPKLLYRLLANPYWATQMPWQRVHLVWGDERFVPHDHPESNFRMVRETLLDHVPISPEHVHPIDVTGTPEEAARAYERVLRSIYGAAKLDPARPLLDVALLGLGADGHTASLFPGTSALDEKSRWVVPVVGSQQPSRITLTYPALNSSAASAFIVTGDDKREIWKRLQLQDTKLPATGIRPAGPLCMFVDQACAGAAS